MSLQEMLGMIRQQQEHFSAAQKLVAAYVLENYHQIPFLSISAIAKNIGVSDNTIIKFCNQLGFAKFAQFKQICAQHAHAELVMSNKLSQAAEPQQDDLFARELTEGTAAIHATLTDPVNQENLPRLLAMMDKAAHIYITGGRASSTMAQLLANMLRYLHYKVYELDSGAGDYPDRLAMVDKKDLVIAISFPRYTAYVVDALKDLHSADVPIALITDTGLSPAAPYADLCFHCSVSSGFYFSSYSGCLALINVISRAAGASRKNDAANHIRQLEGKLISDGVFTK